MKVATETSILIRDIKCRSEMRAVEDLQKEIWGIPDLDVVPLSQLAAAVESGGVLVGAFDGDVLVGFAYGFVGQERGVVVHHSHMLAVKPEYRGQDLGFRLKLAQRERVLRNGITVMSWTFDPLQSLNAHFNFRKLGVVADRYFANFYGDDASSFLHRNGTDRLWVTWRLACDGTAVGPEGKGVGGLPTNVPALVEIGENDVPILNDLEKALSERGVAVEIPADINAIERESPRLAAEWRNATRIAFSAAMDRGFTVEDFYRTGLTDCRIGTYVLVRRDDKSQRGQDDERQTIDPVSGT